MRPSFLIIVLVTTFIVLAFLGGCAPAGAQVPSHVFHDQRTWTFDTGQRGDGTFVGVAGGNVLLEDAVHGTVRRYPLSRLSQADQRYVRAHVDNPPDDSQYFYTVLFTESQAGTPRDQQLLSWFDNHAQLSTLKSGTHWKHYWKDHQMYKARLSKYHSGVFPSVWIVGPPNAPGGPAPVLYQAAGSSVPSSADQLAREIQHNVYNQRDLWQNASLIGSTAGNLIGQCQPWNPFCPDREPDRKPDLVTPPDGGQIPNQPWFKIAPDIYPTFHFQDAMPIVLLLLLGGGAYWYITKD